MDAPTPTPALDARRWLRARELTQRLGVNKVTVWRWVKAGRFPAPHQLGGTRSVFWSLAEIEAWEASHHAPASPPAKTEP